MRYYEPSPSGLYRSRDGLLAGVCRGVAEFFDISVFWTRAAAVVGVLFTGFWPVAFLYLLAAFVMKPEPYVRWGA